MKRILFFSFLTLGNIVFSQANNNCSGATVISDLNGGCTTYNNTGATLDAAPNNIIGSCFEQTNTVWFQFTAQGFQADIDVLGPNNFKPEVAVFGATDGTFCDGTGVYQIGCWDGPSGNYTGLTNMVAYPLTIGETYYVMVSSNTTGNYDICVNNPVPSQGDFCQTADPFCTGTSYTFPANTNTAAPDGLAYGCLLTQANPVWYYLEVATSGNIDITMTNSNNRDIDFIMWGPFTSVSDGCDPGVLNSSTIEDCSYSVASTEVANITGAIAGETYILLITNFSNQATDISFSQTGGLGATDCGIILPVELMDFSGHENSSSNLLTWSTASESNNDYFQVEQSTDMINWRIAGTVNGAGNSSSLKNYTFEHFDFERSLNYYKLRQVDMDGESTTSQIIAIDNRLSSKEILKINNLMGQEVDDTYKGIVIVHFTDGTTIKKLQ